jgi:two-component system, sensor histidine kinase and response regulator
MNGEVGADGEPGRGSTFWLRLPLRKNVAAVGGSDPRLSAEAVLVRDHRGASVLLVEDEPMNQEVAIEFLREIGLAPVLAKDGAEAVQLVQANHFDVILMDLKMPRLDGLQATAAIRALSGREAVPILAMTANAFREDRERCLDAGMNDFISKPFDVDKLCETLLRWLGGR